MISNIKYWLLWLVVTILIGGYFGYQLMTDEKQAFLPGKTTHGHYQIEMSCASCHTDPFGGQEVLQDACMNCHAAELKEARDSHPKSKFTDPRNASRVKQLDARVCVTCHTEHKVEITQAMGVSLPEDYCFKCHADIADDRISHKGMDFKTCATGGCHNYHDNRALYEDFLAKHIGESEVLEHPRVALRSDASYLTLIESYPLESYPVKKLTANEADFPVQVVSSSQESSADWLSTSHSNVGVNCTACHNVKQTNGSIKWVDKPDYSTCKSCHQSEVKGFLSGKHGMRLKTGLSPMRPELARQPMKKEGRSKELSCASCHAAHEFDVKHAAVEACLNCHDDLHTKKYKQSPHFKLWHMEVTGKASPGTGVSCASCHMPRREIKQNDKTLLLSEHNQNHNLRPNEKMLRGVCMQCHGLGFSINALADEKLIENNFTGAPSAHNQSIDMVKKRLGEKKRGGEGSL